jgi:hypothetical protein
MSKRRTSAATATRDPIPVARVALQSHHPATTGTAHASPWPLCRYPRPTATTRRRPRREGVLALPSASPWPLRAATRARARNRPAARRKDGPRAHDTRAPLIFANSRQRASPGRTRSLPTSPTGDCRPRRRNSVAASRSHPRLAATRRRPRREEREPSCRPRISAAAPRSHTRLRSPSTRGTSSCPGLSTSVRRPSAATAAKDPSWRHAQLARLTDW